MSQRDNKNKTLRAFGLKYILTDDRLKKVVPEEIFDEVRTFPPQEVGTEMMGDRLGESILKGNVGDRVATHEDIRTSGLTGLNILVFGILSISLLAFNYKSIPDEVVKMLVSVPSMEAGAQAQQPQTREQMIQQMMQQEQ